MFAALLNRHRRALLAVAFALALAGLFAGIKLPVGLFPVTSFPRIRVEVSAGSRPARRMLIDVTQKLEEVARAVPGAVDVSSTTSRGSAEIFVDFPWGFDMTRALLTVDAAFARQMPDLPKGTTYDIIQMSPNVLMPFVSYALVSKTESPAALRRLARTRIVPLLTGLKGVRRVGVLGGKDPEVEVAISPASLRAHGLTLAGLAHDLGAANTVKAVGRLEDNDLLYLVVADDSFTALKSIRALPVRLPKGGVVPLSDIASVAWGSVPSWMLVNDDGRPAVTFDVYQQDSADSLHLAKEVAKRLATFMKTQSPDLHLYKWYDQTRLVRSSIGAVIEAILIGLAFAALVVLGFLRNWRAALVAMTIVPLSVLTTVLLLDLLGMTFNIMTLGGIAAAIGIMIDDAIVMIEHLARRAGAEDAARGDLGVFEAAREFLAPLFGSSLATVIIFLPLAFLSGVTGAFFRFLSVTMASSIVISFILTALIVPLLARALIDFERWHDPHDTQGRLPRAHGALLDRLFARPLWAALGVAVLIGAGWFAYGHVGTGFLPRMDEGGFVLDYQAKPGTSLAETNRELEEVEAILRKNPYVYTYSRRTGAGLGGDLNETYQGDFFVRLIPASKRPSVWKIMDRIGHAITQRVPGISIDPHQLLGDMIGDMVGRRQPVVIDLQAVDPKILFSVAPKVAAAIAKVPGIEPASINDGVVPAGDALNIRVDRAAAALAGISPADIRAQLRAYLHGTVVTRFAGSTREIGVRLSLKTGHPSLALTRGELARLPIRTASGRVVPLSQVARIQFVAGQPEITRDNLAQIVAVTAEIGGGHDLGSTVAGVKKALARPGLLPPGVTYSIGGAYKQQQMAAEGMTKVFAAAAIAEFILLLFLYDRIMLAVLVIGSAVLSSGAVFIGLWIAGVEFNITAMMGMVMIVGIATEMAIFFASEARALEGSLPRREALRRAAITRLRPIVMSSLAMILALLPLGAALSGSGDQMLQPLAIAIIAGIIVQLPLVLVVLPVAVDRLTPGRR